MSTLIPQSNEILLWFLPIILRLLIFPVSPCSLLIVNVNMPFLKKRIKLVHRVIDKMGQGKSITEQWRHKFKWISSVHLVKRFEYIFYADHFFLQRSHHLADHILGINSSGSFLCRSQFHQSLLRSFSLGSWLSFKGKCFQLFSIIKFLSFGFNMVRMNQSRLSCADKVTFSF